MYHVEVALLHSENSPLICDFHGGSEIIHVFKLHSYCPRNKVLLLLLLLMNTPVQVQRSHTQS